MGDEGGQVAGGWAEEKEEECEGVDELDGDVRVEEVREVGHEHAEVE